MSAKPVLDPLLAPALQLEERPIVPARMYAVQIADDLIGIAERLATRIALEADHDSAQQLTNVAEALGVSVLSLVAYSRGVVPKVSSKPKTNLIVPS